MFYLYRITINKCKGSCNTINDLYDKLCVKTCKCKCKLDASVCNKKQRWNEDKCRCE